MQRVLERIEAQFAAHQARWLDWLRIPSISAQPAHAADCRAAAAFACDALTAIGFTASLRETPGHPIVVAHHPGPGPDAPHLLYYGHYDVQPPEPLELWTSPPFVPTISGGTHGPCVVARGAVDDKGQVSMWLSALTAWVEETGGLPVRVTALIEGEEEIGSLNLDAFLAANRDELQADVAIVSDTNMWDIDTPAITTRLRGLVYVEVELTAATRDLHSGMYGGSALNAANALTGALGALHDAAGRVMLPDFYKGVAEIPPELAADWAALGFDETEFLHDIGLGDPVGEAGRGGLERLWARPTCDINGIWGGYAGPGAKTVIPGKAGAKVSFRLVPGQDPAAVLDGFKRFMAAHVPTQARLAFREFGVSPGIEVPAGSRFIEAACAALAEEYERAPVLIGSGGSIPLVGSLRRLLGLDTVLMGFGLSDDRIHSPNEKFNLRCFHQGLRTHARLLGRLGGG
jgi:acetylornithine deacetylase/succinyl-diaminopimelate desuccinylase-like protein